MRSKWKSRLLVSKMPTLPYLPLIVLLGKLKGLFGKGSSEANTETDSKTGSASSSSASVSETEKAKKPSVKEERIPLTIDVTFMTIPPMTVAEKRQARDR